MEEFKACVPTSIKMYVNEQKATTLHQAAVLADDYSLTHRCAFVPTDSGGSASNKDDKSTTLPSHPRMLSGKHRYQHGKGRNANRSQSVICDYCKRRGHVMAECWSLQQRKKPDILVHTMSETSRLSEATVENKPSLTVPDVKLSVEEKLQRTEPDCIYLPFVLASSVALTAEETAVPVKILHDTAATQSLLLQSVLPLAEQASAGASVLVQGVELGVLKVPLHKVCLRSNLVLGEVTVGIRPTLPIQGIAFILGNDLAGGKVNLNPELQVIDEPEQQLSLENEQTDIYPACVVTQLAARETMKQ